MRVTCRCWVMIVLVTWSVVGAFLAPAASALEGDGYSVPSRPLDDVGPHFGRRVRQAVGCALDKVNQRYRQHCEIARTTHFPHKRWMYTQLARECVSERNVMLAVFQELGMHDRLYEGWLLDCRGENASFAVPMEDSIYACCVKKKPLLRWAMSPMVNMHGVYFTTDKIGHFFKQGFQHHHYIHRLVQAGEDQDYVEWERHTIGRDREKQYFGWWVTGCYSNADLAADHAGSKFYENLLEPLELEGIILPPILVRGDCGWMFNPEAEQDFVRFFISEHFNEAMNPCWFTSDIRGDIQCAIDVRAESWFAFFNTDASREARRNKELMLWHGEEYGHGGLEAVSTWGETKRMLATAQ